MLVSAINERYQSLTMFVLHCRIQVQDLLMHHCVNSHTTFWHACAWSGLKARTHQSQTSR